VQFAADEKRRDKLLRPIDLAQYQDYPPTQTISKTDKAISDLGNRPETASGDVESQLSQVDDTNSPRPEIYRLLKRRLGTVDALVFATRSPNPELREPTQENLNANLDALVEFGFIGDENGVRTAAERVIETYNGIIDNVGRPIRTVGSRKLRLAWTYQANPSDLIGPPHRVLQFDLTDAPPGTTIEEDDMEHILKENDKLKGKISRMSAIRDNPQTLISALRQVTEHAHPT
jgi:hypothetical protein